MNAIHLHNFQKNLIIRNNLQFKLYILHILVIDNMIPVVHIERCKSDVSLSCAFPDAPLICGNLCTL